MTVYTGLGTNLISKYLLSAGGNYYRKMKLILMNLQRKKIIASLVLLVESPVLVRMSATRSIPVTLSRRSAWTAHQGNG